MPTLEYVRQEQKQEKPSIRDQLRTAAKPVSYTHLDVYKRQPKPEKKSNTGMILVIFALAGAAGAAYYYIKFVKGRKLKDEDMDFFDDEGYEEEPYINEDEEPQIAEDAETDGDED